MATKSTSGGAGAQARRDKAEETTATAKAMIDAGRKAAIEKTERLKAARLAKEAADADAETKTKAKPKAAKPARATRKSRS